MPTNPVYPDEIILAALLQGGSIRKAASIVPCGVTTIRERLRNDDFRRQYDALKGELLQEAAGELSAKMGAAVERLSEIMLYLPSESSLADSAREDSHTRAARIRVSSPSGRSG